MERLIRHRITTHFLLPMLLGQFIDAAWSCPIETEMAPASLSGSIHDEHQAHMQTSRNTEAFYYAP